MLVKTLIRMYVGSTNSYIYADIRGYPKFRPARFKGDKHTLVDVGDFLVNTEGELIIATTSNKAENDTLFIKDKPDEWPNEFLRDLNEGSFRACFIGGDEDTDWLQPANQVRHATAREIERAKKYKPIWQATIE